MKTKARIWENAVVLTVGILLICLNGNAHTLPALVRIIGIGFIVPGLINIFSLRKGHGEAATDPGQSTGLASRGGNSSRVIGWIASVGAILLGLVLLIFPHYFEQALVYILAGAVILGGIYHIFLIGKGYQPVSFPGWFYIVPVAMILIGAYVLFTTGAEAQRHIELIILGSGFILFALMGYLEVIAAASFHRQLRKNGTVQRHDTSTEPAETVKAEEVRSDKATFE